MMFQFKDKVVVTNPKYVCADVGTVGEIADNGSLTTYGIERYLVRWESSPTMLWGVNHTDIRIVTW